MAQIRQTVELLTKILRSNGTSKIKPEIFRQAKFDQVEAVEPLWKLLFEVIYYIKYGSIDDITIRAYSELSKEEICVYVKCEMKLRGFVSRSFHELSNDMSSGSRELLLAFGWLMCRTGLINRFMEQCCSFLDSESALQMKDVPSLKYFQQPPVAGLDLKDKVAYLMWLNGKLRLNLRNLNTLEHEKENLTNKIINATRGVSTNPSKRNNLTILEVLMLKNPELLRKNLKLLDADNQRLEALITWQQHDEIFWKWMESVLDVKIADSGLIDEVSETITPRTQATKDRVECKLQLTESVNKYTQLVEQMEKDILEQKGTSSEELDILLQSITEDIQTHRQSITSFLQASRNDSSHMSSVRQKPDVHPKLKEARNNVLTRESSMTSVSAAEGEILQVESELNDLQSLVERLQADIEYKQSKYKDELSSVSSGIDSLCEYISRGPTIFKSTTTN